jgi:hypothetical protein
MDGEISRDGICRRSCARAGGELPSGNIYSNDGGDSRKAGAMIESGTEESHNVELTDGPTEHAQRPEASVCLIAR